jgi:hypothetical protein
VDAAWLAYNEPMGWSCTSCGDVNSSVLDVCQECGTKIGADTSFRLQPQPFAANVLWMSTFFGGALSGFAVAIWNGRVLRKHSHAVTALYAAMAVIAWLATVWCLANLEPSHWVSFPNFMPEPGFAIPAALALGFLLVAIPYNLDTLSVNQWMWNHPGRKLVVELGPGLRLGYASFSGADGDLFGPASSRKPWITIPVLPLVAFVASVVIGIATLFIANAFALPLHHHR